jgi:hypothetical protein
VTLPRAAALALLSACSARVAPAPDGSANPPAPPGLTPAPPETILLEGPAATTTDRTATFRFSSPTATGFECRMDQPTFVSCASPRVYDVPRTGDHAFDVRAVLAGVADPTPAHRAWRLESPFYDIAIVPANDAWTESDGGWLLDEDLPQRMAANFFETHDDVYDFLVVWTDFLTLNYSAFGGPLRLDIAGLGQEQRYQAPLGTDFTEVSGSPGFLQSVVFMNGKPFWDTLPYDVLDVLAQEVGHRWLAFVPLLWETDPWVLLDPSVRAHWNLFVGLGAPSPLGRSLQWTRQNADGSFTSLSPSPSEYSSIDLYAMGMLPAAEVPDFFFVRNPRDFDPPFDPLGQPWTADSPVLTSVTFSGERVDVAFADVVASLGPRDPSFGQAQTSFRQAFVLVVPPGSGAAMDTLEWLDDLRQGWEGSFHRATLELGTVDTRLR